MSDTQAANSAGTAVSAGESNSTNQAKVSFELPPEDTRTALHANDRTLVVNLRTGQQVPEPIARDRKAENLILLCLEPSKKGSAQSEAALRVAEKLVRPGDKVIMMSVLPLQVIADAGLAAFATPYDVNYQVKTLRKMREERVKDFAELAKNFPEGVEVYARVVHGGPERQILLAAEETNCSAIIIGKRKLGIWQKLVTPSVSNWIVSHAPCDVLIAK